MGRKASSVYPVCKVISFSINIGKLPPWTLTTHSIVLAVILYITPGCHLSRSSRVYGLLICIEASSVGGGETKLR